MLDIRDYTSYDEVRSVSGMSIDELPDTELALLLYANALELELDGLTIATTALNPIKTVFFTLDQDTDSTAYNLTRMFSTYTVALEVYVSLSMKAPKTLSDSKVTIGRFSPESTFKDAIQAVKDKLSQIRDSLIGIGAEETDTTLPYLTAIKPDYDPVTGA